MDDCGGEELGPDPLVVVTSPRTLPELEGTLPDGVELAVQEEPRGTGDAVASARPALAGFAGDIVVLAGDAPLLSAAELRSLLDLHRKEAAATVLSFEPDDPGSYGRIVRTRRAASRRSSRRATQARSSWRSAR